MHNNEIYVGLDIGTAMIKVIVVETQASQVNVIGVGNVPSQGVKRGVIVDINETAAAIKAAVAQAATKANIQIDEVVAGIPANQLKIEQIQGMTAIVNDTKRISYDDVREVARQALISNLPPEREIIDVLPSEFIVDGFDGISDPYDMVGVRLEMRGIAFTGPKTITHNVRMAVERAGLKLREFVVTPLAVGRTALNDGEQDFGTILIDMGAGQTTAAVIHDHQLKFITVDQEGGEYITRDISTVLNTTYEYADKAKRDYGCADSTLTSEQNEFLIESVGQREPIRVSEKYLSEIIEARVDQIFSNLFKQLQPTGALEMPGGIVLTGGSSLLGGVPELLQQMFGMNVRIEIPSQIGIRHPSYMAGFAIARYAAAQTQTERVVKEVIFGNQLTTAQQDEPVLEKEKKHGFFTSNFGNEEKYQASTKMVDEQAMEENDFQHEPQKNVKDKVKNFIANFFD
ncbi:cell division protein FtsA [Periweissella ghanensis]|uniref:Cell division protein FtsA n=1 Tax=Periweissella ghanensis TaxID=467997 RepID=A0ABN8BKJ1_9LACO|nr:cell division protein FtsA [Periweissella ghanensis]MCM0599969.1 cell division protein FtsA [Periweissella ghanensis]CAH0418232.1 Cell division protein FtsA [Periweissella ghanensis]